MDSKKVLVLLTILGFTLLAGWQGAKAEPISDSILTFSNGVFGGMLQFEEGSAFDRGIVTVTSLANTSATGDPSQFGSPTVLLEPDGSISDVFGVVKSPDGVYQFAFISDDLGISSVPADFGTNSSEFKFLQEGNGGPFNATPYLSPALRDAGWAFQFQSDTDAVPEPSTILLLSSGLIGLAGYGRKKFFKK